MNRIRTAGLVAAFLAGFVASAFGQTINRSGGGATATPGGDCSGTIAALVCTKSNGVAFGTAAFQNTGTSGATLPFLNGVNTWSGLQTYTGGENNTVNGAANVSAKTFAGTPFAGTTANSVPLVYLNNGNAVSSFATGGTYLGINAASGCTTTSNLLAMYVNGSATASFLVNCLGTTTIAGGAITLASNGGITLAGNVSMGNGGIIVFGSRGLLTSKASGNIQLGLADAAAPLPQTLSMQSVVAGTSNTAGQASIFQGSLSTGSGLSGDMAFGTGGTGAGATVQNSAVEAMNIKGATQIIRFSKTYTVATLPTCNAGVSQSWTMVSDATAPTYAGVLVGSGAVTTPVFCDGATWKSH